MEGTKKIQKPRIKVFKIKIQLYVDVQLVIMLSCHSPLKRCVDQE